MAASSTARMIYGCQIANWFVMCPNYLTVMVGTGYLIVTTSLCRGRTRDILTLIMVGYAALLAGLGILTTFSTTRQRHEIWGATGMALVIIYYGSPLTSLRQILSSRCSSSLHPGMVACNMAGSLLSVAYGFVINDPYVYVPNCLGVAVSFMCCALLCALPHTPAKAGAKLVDLGRVDETQRLMRPNDEVGLEEVAGYAGGVAGKDIAMVPLALQEKNHLWVKVSQDLELGDAQVGDDLYMAGEESIQIAPGTQAWDVEGECMLALDMPETPPPMEPQTPLKETRGRP
ncbi:hypothetical protein H632_c817p0 [Helicosporidium sp. ATCC 50920]|nr:hypothetical protein H632_c817p0 [Helicosporidium sp. ATCC 50920]|eukprot:KDD75192.1 hypothetical protein H632_c817p0 [Helicosporidium sp. ATCC 50920]